MTQLDTKFEKFTMNNITRRMQNIEGQSCVLNRTFSGSGTTHIIIKID